MNVSSQAAVDSPESRVNNKNGAVKPAASHVHPYLFLLFAITFCLSVASRPLADVTAQVDPRVLLHLEGPFTESHVGWAGVSGIGDINGDGFDDVAISSDDPAGTYIFFGGNPVDTLPDMLLRGSRGAVPAELTGDGVSDVITSECYNELTSNSDGVIYFYRGFVDSIGSEPFDSIRTDTLNRGLGYELRTAFVDSDSCTDLLALARDWTGGPRLYLFLNPITTDKEPDWHFWVSDYSHAITSFGFIDWNGDNQEDIFIALGADLDTLSYVYLFLGPEYGNQPDVILGYVADVDSTSHELFARKVSALGDIDGDLEDDLVLQYGSWVYVYKGGPLADTLPDYQLSVRYNGDMANVGDINGDGYSDLAMGGSFRVFMVGGVDLYLGGGEWDVYPDQLYTDVNLRPWEPMDDIGLHVSSAGDYDGDDLSDLIIVTRNFHTGRQGRVFVVAGDNAIVTDVDDEPMLALPEAYELKQNYPNPFNASTVIEFDLPQRVQVELTVYNVLGELVTTLLDRELAAGTHRVSWSGEKMASGVYLVRLTSELGVLSRKMVLVK